MDSTVTVQEVMDREFVGVSESDTVTETAELLLETERDCVVVLRGNDPVGLLTQRDALASFVRAGGDEPVAEAMSDAVPTVDPDVTIGEAASELSARGTPGLVVTGGDGAVGVLDEHDLLTTAPFDVTGEASLDYVGGPVDADAAGSPVDADAVGSPVDDRDATASGAGGFEDQSICEACGSFARDLATFNGQLLCADCRDI